MNKKKIALLCAGGCLCFVLAITAKSLHKIPPGYVGVVYSLNGGIRDGILSQGLKLTSPLAKVNIYSVATEQAYLSRDKKEGSKDDDSFLIPTSDGKTVNVDLEFSYHFDSENLPTTFTRFKGQDGKTIEDTFIRGKIKAWAAEVSSTFSVIDIYGEKRAELNAQVLEHVKNKFEEYGIVIDSVNFSRIELDQATAEAIQQRVNKQQELETAKLEAQKAEIEAERKRVEAQGEADASVIKAQGEADANSKLQESITPELLKKMELEARLEHGWITVQGATPVVTVPNENTQN